MYKHTLMDSKEKQKYVSFLNIIEYTELMRNSMMFFGTTVG